MEKRVLEIVSSFVKTSVAELENVTNQEGVWDSLQKVEIIIGLEDEFDISFTQEEISKINTIADIVNLIQGKL